MEAYAYNFGHPLRKKKSDPDWVYLDGQPNTEEVYQQLICPRCNNKPTKEGHDPCIANLKGVKAACCDHGLGLKEHAYIFFEDGRVVRFDSTEEILEYVEKNKLRQNDYGDSVIFQKK